MSASWFSISKSTLIDILRKLQTVFDTKADSSHTHTKSDIADFAHDHPLSIEAASTATSAINLDPNAIYKLTAGGKTFIFKTPADNDHYAWADITGKPSSYPPSTHTHTKSQITDFPSTMPPSSHTHGNVQNGGTLQTNDVAIANGDKLVITDSSDSSKIARASIAFDGSTATKCLTQKGTWENFTNNAGTITGIKMNGSTVGSSGVVDLGTVITSHQDISGKVNKTGDSMSGPLCMNSAKDNYREGIRINAGANGYSTLTIGTESNSTEGISDKSFWIGTNRTNASHARKLYIAHNSSTASTTLFYAENSSQVSPYLQIGSRLDIKGLTVGTNTYDDTNPKLRFLNSDATQNISLTFTDYDAVQSPASLTLNGNQGGEYFIAPNIKATGKFYGTLQGNADTATKLATAMKIALGGDFTGSANFDGSANIVIDSNFYYSSINSGNKSNYPWHRIACCSGKTGQYTDVDAILDIRHAYNGGRYGRIKISLRTNSTNVGVNISATWLYRYGFSADSIKIACWGVTGQAVYADVFINVSAYARAGVYQVEGSRAWTLVTSSEANDTTASDPKTSTECWASIEAAGTALHNKAYTSIVSATDGGTVSYANNAGSIPWSGVSDKPTSFTPSSHTHGNIQNGGTLQTNDITIANGDKLVVTDSSDSSKIARASISFDGSTATKCLTQKGTWETFASSNTDTKVTQTATTTNSYYEVLFSETADNTTRTEGARKTSTLSYNPNKKIFKVSGSVKAEVANIYSTTKLNTTTDTWAFNVADYNEATVFGVHFNNNMAIAELGNSYYGEGYKARGYLRIYGGNTAYTSLSSDVSTTNRDINFPDKSGTIALTSDIVDTKVTQTENDTSTGTFPVLLSSQLAGTTSDFTGSTYKSKNLQFSPKNADLCMYGANSKLVFEVWCQGADTTKNSREVLVKVGNNTATGTSGNRYGILRLYSQQTYKADIMTAGTYTANRTFTLPDKTGIIALTSDLDSYLPLAGGTMTGTLINSNANAYICSYANQHYMLRNDGNAWYFMSSATIGGWDKGYVCFDTSMNLNMCYHSITNQSDRRSKKDITLVDDDKLINFYSQLKPSKFKFINNTEDKYNYGFIAQDVEEAMNDSGISVKDKALIRLPEEDHSMGEPRYSLSYMEFIPLNTRMIQLLTKRIEALESKLT